MKNCKDCIHYHICQQYHKILYEGKVAAITLGVEDVVRICRDFEDKENFIEVVWCKDCIRAQPFDPHCELNSKAYMNCIIGRGETVCNVWHKYKKYYRDYSVVDRYGFCDEGVRRGDDDNENK